MRNLTTKAFSLAVGIFFAAVAMSPSANAGSLRQGSTGQNSAVTGSLPGEVLWAYYLTDQSGFFCPPFDNSVFDGLCNTASDGDNILRLVNPNGAANGNLAGARAQTVCAMIYVFDDDEEMGECCGCPLSSTRLATFSVDQNLISNWGLTAGTGNGAIAIVATAPNTTPLTPGGGGSAAQCLGSGCCDPTNVPGYSVTTASNLLGSITHNSAVTGRITTDLDDVSFGLTETALSDDGGGDPTNLIYLQNQCGALIGNGTGGGICNCPIE